MKKTYNFAPGVIERYPRRRWTGMVSAALNLDALAVACLLTAAAASIGWLLGGVL